jgi:hypothetical protein
MNLMQAEVKNAGSAYKMMLTQIGHANAAFKVEQKKRKAEF